MESIQEHATNHRRGPHRSEYEIIDKILNIVSYSNSISGPELKKCKPIDIVYGCCLTWHQFQLYRNQLMRLNRLNSIQTDGHEFYEITDKGLKYVQVFYELQAEMKPLADYSSENTLYF